MLANTNVVMLVLAITVLAVLRVQRSAGVAPALVFDGVTVVDVEQGKLVYQTTINP